MNETPDRVPFSDFYWTDSGRHAGMHARPVIGGVFIRLLDRRQAVLGDAPSAWPSGTRRTSATTGPRSPASGGWRRSWRTARDGAASWRYTVDRPAGDWMAREFDDRTWKEGQAGFGTPGTPGAEVRTVWNGPEIWLRRDIQLPEAVTGGDPSTLRLIVHHDEDAEIYLNGVLAARAGGYTSDYQPVRIRPEALKALKPGRNSLAVHCRQTSGGQYIDVGVGRVEVAAP